MTFTVRSAPSGVARPSAGDVAVMDAVIIGSGPNGLVAANQLVDVAWRVVVVEASANPGGGVQSADYLGVGFISDVCSAFYPFAAASPSFADLRLEDHGLEWSHAPSVLAHPLPDGRCPVLSRDLDTTLASMEALGSGDAASWARLADLWDLVGDDLLSALFTPFPPIRSGLKLARRLGPRGVLDFARMAVIPVRRVFEEQFTGPGAMLLAGCAMHADLAPETATSAIFGWLLAMLSQSVGFPVSAGGAQSMTDAMARRFTSQGGELITGTAVSDVIIRHGRAVGVRLADGREIDAGRAVLADAAAPLLYGGLVPWEELPPSFRTSMDTRFQWDYATVKVDWALNGPVPWIAAEARGAGTVHLSTLDEMTMSAARIATGTISESPFLLIGQMTTADARRSPLGTESLWAYTHVPRQVRGDAAGNLTGRWDAGECAQMADRMEERIEAYAPGFRQEIRARNVPAHPGFGAPGDTYPGIVPRFGFGPPGRRGTRCMRCERRPRRHPLPDRAADLWNEPLAQRAAGRRRGWHEGPTGLGLSMYFPCLLSRPRRSRIPRPRVGTCGSSFHHSWTGRPRREQAMAMEEDPIRKAVSRTPSRNSQTRRRGWFARRLMLPGTR